MSELAEAVQAEIDAHTPRALPAFDALKERRRTRYRRRLAAGGAVLAVLAVAGATTAGSVPGSDTQLAAGGVEAPDASASAVFLVPAAPAYGTPATAAAAAKALQRCRELPGAVSARATGAGPRRYLVTVTGSVQIARFESCLRAVPGYTPQPAPQGVTAEPLPGGPSCDTTSLDSPPDAAALWENYLRWQDRVYTEVMDSGSNTPEPTFGEQLGTVACTRANSRTPLQHTIAEGEAAYLSTGTAFYAVAGRDPTRAVGATQGGKKVLFSYDPELTAELDE